MTDSEIREEITPEFINWHNNRRRRLRGFAIYEQHLISVLSGRYEIYGLPPDAEFIRAYYEPMCNSMVIVVRSESYDQLSEGEAIRIASADLRER